MHVFVQILTADEGDESSLSILLAVRSYRYYGPNELKGTNER